MAAQISHVVYASKALKTILKDRKVNEKDYYLGTLFPDIRYRAKIDRNLTHFNPVDIGDLTNAKNDFELGMLVHSLVDIERENIVKDSGIYSMLPSEIGIYTFVKLVEEKYTYPLYDDWSKVASYLDEVCADEVRLIDKTTVYRWHTILQNLFAKPPTKRSLLKFAEEIGIRNEATNFYKKYGHFANNPSLICAIKSIYPLLFERIIIPPK